MTQWPGQDNKMQAARQTYPMSLEITKWIAASSADRSLCTDGENAKQNSMLNNCLGNSPYIQQYYIHILSDLMEAAFGIRIL